MVEIVEKWKNLTCIFQADLAGEALDQWVLNKQTVKTGIKLGKLWKKQVRKEEDWEKRVLF